MKLVEYNPEFKFPIWLCCGRELYFRSMSVAGAKKLYKELGEVLKEIPPEKHEPVRFGPADEGRQL